MYCNGKSCQFGHSIIKPQKMISDLWLEMNLMWEGLRKHEAMAPIIDLVISSSWSRDVPWGAGGGITIKKAGHL